ncbi:glutamine synthetase III [uncultured Brachyspira sp.]|uniref:glutamine synthetase III family protein n=1 Tax=uncultured Brachyspira sp. TaxID=221953 RepID=UPI0025CD12CA|nr:glutamine synthetase III [uncultured Brachyspira sp.]
MDKLPDIFESYVFNDNVMQEKLPKDIYKKLIKTIKNGERLDLELANVVAHAMKEWAIEKGATHFTHWFQPMTGVTAEKHTCFITQTKDGKVRMEFTGKELVQGEPDASSFPSGGLRSTFEARGYTAWDPTSYAFIKDNTLCIPSAFCSYSGESLDKKTPLLRSMQVIEREAKRILKLFGHNDINRVYTTVGAEQEYFLIDRDLYLQRPDLRYCKRTLFGACPPKGQELEDHYFGAIKPRVLEFMKELDNELWKLGIIAKTEHNEVAPGQYELAPEFTITNMATDQNQITMELMKVIAEKHNLACILHEKPFSGVNGSGKHNNWSIATDTGLNLFEPGKTPSENKQFLLFIVAVMKAVDEYQDLLRATTASASNDHRLGASEAPPAIISIFLGDELTEIIESMENSKKYKKREAVEMEMGVAALARFTKDSTDRNRTSPLAFTGNKFEFRMVGSSLSVSGPNIVLNTIVAEALSQFADILEKSSDFDKDLEELLKENIKKHKRIIYNGNNYSDEWVKEAHKRGLCNLKTTPEALETFISQKNIDLFTKHNVLTKAEVLSRYEISLEEYTKVINIEALTLIDMINKYIIPFSLDYIEELANICDKKKNVKIKYDVEKALLDKITNLTNNLYDKLKILENYLSEAKKINNISKSSVFFRDKVFACIEEMRPIIDELERTVSKKHWKLPTYGDMLYSLA